MPTSSTAYRWQAPGTQGQDAIVSNILEEPVRKLKSLSLPPSLVGFKDTFVSLLRYHRQVDSSSQELSPKLWT